MKRLIALNKSKQTKPKASILAQTEHLCEQLSLMSLMQTKAAQLIPFVVAPADQVKAVSDILTKGFADGVRVNVSKTKDLRLEMALPLSAFRHD